MLSGNSDFRRTRALLDRLTADGTLPGASILVLHDGQEKFRYAAGLARVDPPVRATTEHVWAIASITKTISTVAMLKLVDNGAFHLDQPVVELLPEFGPGKERVLVRQLVSHTSGLSDRFPDPDKIAALGWVKALGAMPLVYEPGTASVYSTAAFEVVKALVVKYGGRPWTQYLGDEIFRPLGMVSTMFVPPSDLGDRKAVVYEPGGRTDNWANDPNSNAMEMAGRGLFSTLDDLAAFGRPLAEAEGGGLISSDSYSAMRTVQTPGLRDLNGGHPVTWGLGCYINKEAAPNGFGRYISEAAFGHGGATGTRLTIDPPNRLVIVFLGNRMGLNTEESGDVEGLIADSVMQDLGLAGTPRY